MFSLRNNEHQHHTGLTYRFYTSLESVPKEREPSSGKPPEVELRLRKVKLNTHLFSSSSLFPQVHPHQRKPHQPNPRTSLLHPAPTKIQTATFLPVDDGRFRSTASSPSPEFTSLPLPLLLPNSHPLSPPFLLPSNENDHQRRPTPRFYPPSLSRRSLQPSSPRRRGSPACL